MSLNRAESSSSVSDEAAAGVRSKGRTSSVHLWALWARAAWNGQQPGSRDVRINNYRDWRLTPKERATCGADCRRFDGADHLVATWIRSRASKKSPLEQDIYVFGWMRPRCAGNRAESGLSAHRASRRTSIELCRGPFPDRRGPRRYDAQERQPSRWRPRDERGRAAQFVGPSDIIRWTHVARFIGVSPDGVRR